MSDGFSNKEMLERILNKLDQIELKNSKRFQQIEIKINDTHELAAATNGKVRLHTKIFMWVGGVITTLIGGIITLVLAVVAGTKA